MGACMSASHFRHAGSRGVLVLGLDGAGATTILYQLVLGKRLETIPTLGLNQESVTVDGLELECWDIGGLDQVRPLWRQYSRDADAVIFVVDSSDVERLKLASTELASLYKGHSKRNYIQHDRPLLIFANKQDTPTAVSTQQVEKVLKVNYLHVDTFRIFPCSANDRETLMKGINWLVGELKGRSPVRPHGDA